MPKRNKPIAPIIQKPKRGLPELDRNKAAVLSSQRTAESKHEYRHAMDEFIERSCSEPRLSLNVFVEKRALAVGTINGRLPAVRRISYEAADASLLSPELAA